LEIPRATLGILVIDDNEEVLSLCRRFFDEPLFHVWTAGTATDGLSVLRDNPAAVDVVLLDLIVPDVSPEDAFSQCKAVKPEVAVVVMSGYHADPRINALLRAGAKGFLRKPFSRKEVRAAVRRILEE
jgi:DNA-binding NtrC family response regulator